MLENNKRYISSFINVLDVEQKLLKSKPKELK